MEQKWGKEKVFLQFGQMPFKYKNSQSQGSQHVLMCGLSMMNLKIRKEVKESIQKNKQIKEIDIDASYPKPRQNS